MSCTSSVLTRLLNSGAGEGLEAWRALARFHDPASEPRKVALLMELLEYSFEGDLTSKVDTFERDLQ
eukprot:11169898-Lingulodinium_polyedra.AAC.1